MTIESLGEVACSACVSGPMTAADAKTAVQRVVVLANHLLREEPGQCPPPNALGARQRRVARLRDELHVTANRVARFGYDENPFLDPVRITAPTASSAVLAPGQLLCQLQLTAARLIEHLDALSTADWMRTGRMGDQVVTLGNLVEGLVHTGTHDVLDLLQGTSWSAPEGVALLDDGRTRRVRRDSLRRTYARATREHGATAS